MENIENKLVNKVTEREREKEIERGLGLLLTLYEKTITKHRNISNTVKFE